MWSLSFRWLKRTPLQEYISCLVISLPMRDQVHTQGRQGCRRLLGRSRSHLSLSPRSLLFSPPIICFGTVLTSCSTESPYPRTQRALAPRRVRLSVCASLRNTFIIHNTHNMSSRSQCTHVEIVVSTRPRGCSICISQSHSRSSLIVSRLPREHIIFISRPRRLMTP